MIRTWVGQGLIGAQTLLIVILALWTNYFFSSLMWRLDRAMERSPAEVYRLLDEEVIPRIKQLEGKHQQILKAIEHEQLP